MKMGTKTCRKCTKIVGFSESNVLSTVSPYEDLAQLEVGNELSTITEFKLLSLIIQGPKNLGDLV